MNNANTDAAGVKKLDASSPNFTGDDGDGLLGPKETWQWTFTENPTVDEMSGDLGMKLLLRPGVTLVPNGIGHPSARPT